jgi:hypothetical protein
MIIGLSIMPNLEPMHMSLEFFFFFFDKSKYYIKKRRGAQALVH